MPSLPHINPGTKQRDELEEFRHHYLGCEKNNIDQVLMLLEIIRESYGTKVNMDAMKSSLKIRINPVSYKKIGEFSDLSGYQELLSLMKLTSKHLRHLKEQYYELNRDQLYHIIDTIELNLLSLKRYLVLRYE